MTHLIAKFLKVLNSETDPIQISLGFCFAMIFGLTPLFSLHNLLVLLAVLVLRVNLSAFIVGWAFFTALSFALDPVFHFIGMAVLTAPSLESFWTALYNTTTFRLAHFNNTVLMGSLIFSVILFIPAMFISNILIVKYREYFLSWIEKTRVMQMFKASKIYRAYQTVQGWRE